MANRNVDNRDTQFTLVSHSFRIFKQNFAPVFSLITLQEGLLGCTFLTEQTKTKTAALRDLRPIKNKCVDTFTGLFHNKLSHRVLGIEWFPLELNISWVVVKMSQNPEKCLVLKYLLVQPTVPNLQTLHLLPQETKKDQQVVTLKKMEPENK